MKIIVAIGEKARDNETIGDQWLITKIFPADIPAKEIIEWAEDKGVTGKIILTAPDNEQETINQTNQFINYEDYLGPELNS